MITAADKMAIREAVEVARVAPIRWADVKDIAIDDQRKEIALADRKGHVSPRATQTIFLFDGYRCQFAFEEQPLGLCRHLSVSVDDPSRVPNIPAMEMIAAEFGITMPPNGRVWLEEFAPGHRAVNVLQIETVGSA